MRVREIKHQRILQPHGHFKDVNVFDGHPSRITMRRPHLHACRLQILQPQNFGGSEINRRKTHLLTRDAIGAIRHNRQSKAIYFATSSSTWKVEADLNGLTFGPNAFM